jgi:carbon-monoxide dehydrogenase large subunit
MPPTADDDPAFDLREGVHTPDRPFLATDRVRYAGEPVAVVVAESRYAAADGVDKVDVEYERLEAVTDPIESTSGDAPQLHESVPDNVTLDWTAGNEEETMAAFDAADHTVELSVVNQRIGPSSMEPRATLAEWRGGSDELRVTVSSQVPHHHRELFASALDVPEHKIHVVSPDVGGGFGLKSKFHNGELIAAWCSMQLDRPVKWQASRSSSFLSDMHGRGHHTTAELALEDDGTITGFRLDTHVDMGGYLSKVSPFIATAAYARVLSGQYRIPGVFCRVRGAMTNKSPMDAYRGAGRPEAAYILERLVRKAAAELGVDSVALRRQNQIPSDAFPYRTPLGVSYDSGNYEETLDTALQHVDYEALRERQAELREEGRYLGIGLGCYTETAAGINLESSIVRFHPSGTVTAFTGTHDHGQGHGTTFAQVLSDQLGVPYDDIEVREGDTDEIPKGTGTYGSRSAVAAGSALVESAGKVVESARKIAAHQFEADPDDVVFEDGEFSVAGVPERSVSIQEVAAAAYTSEDLPEDVEPGLEASSFVRPDVTFPAGVHVAVVEVDPDSGEVEFEQYVGVDDVGNRINPTIVEGQVHGGVAQGIGQALYEGIEYDSNGTLVTGSMQDYTVPKAEHIPNMVTDETVSPAPGNPLGVKGIGEAGCVAAPPAVVNAVVDALEPFGVDHVEMPVTAEKIWQAVDGD